MNHKGCCLNNTLTGGTISSAPTAKDTNYPIGFIGWTPDNKAFLHVGSGTWIALNPDAPPPDPEESHVEE